MQVENALSFDDQVSWQIWLEQNHNDIKEAWLIIHKKHSTSTGIKYEEALEEALRYGWIDGKMYSIDKEKFVLRFSPRRNKSIWSKRNKEKVELLTAQNRMTPAGLAMVREAKKNGLWDKAYSSHTKEEIPADFEAALNENQITRKNFHGLANTYRNMYIRWLNSSRTEKIRKERIAEIVKRVELGQKMRYGNIE